MDPLKACQLLQNLIGRSSSSALELFQLFTALVPANKSLSSSSASENVSASDAAEGSRYNLNKIPMVFPTQIGQNALPFIFDISTIVIKVRVTIFHRYWIQNVLLPRLDKRLGSNFASRPWGDDTTSPAIFKFGFRFTNELCVECFDASISISKVDEKKFMSMPSLMAYTPVKPPFTFDWEVGKHDPKSACGSNLGGSIQRQLPRVVNYAMDLLRRTVRASQSIERSVLLYTPQLLCHIQDRILTLEGCSELYSESQNEIVKKLREKLTSCLKNKEPVVQAGMSSAIEMASQVTNFHQNLETLGNDWIPPSAYPLPNLVPPTGGLGFQFVRNRDAVDSTPSPDKNLEPSVPPARRALNFERPNVLRIILLGIVTELYRILLKLPLRLVSIVDPIVGAGLDKIKLEPCFNTIFSFPRPELGNLQELPFNMQTTLSSSIKLPEIDSVAASVRGLPTLGTQALPPIGNLANLPLPSGLPHLNTAVTAAGSPSSSDLQRVLPKGNLKAHSIATFEKSCGVANFSSVFPKTQRSVSWGTCSSVSESETTETGLKDVLADYKNRKILPKSPKPNKEASGLSPTEATSTSEIRTISFDRQKSQEQILIRNYEAENASCKSFFGSRYEETNNKTQSS